MEENKGAAAGSGIGFCGLLGVAFIVLKLIGVIGWPWIWVLCPLWIGAALGIAAPLIVLFIAVRRVKRRERKRKR